jgi:PEP-CTERM/exosortase A-associated glycosyltransferase
MALRILHLLDHSLPLHSGYTFRTAAILREQRKRGWETFHVTSPKQGASAGPAEMAAGLMFYRTAQPRGPNWPVLNEWGLMRATEARLEELAAELRPHLLHAHSPVLNAMPALRVGRRLGIPVVYEVRAFWEDAAVDHGTTSEGSVRYRTTRALETRALHAAQHVFTICEGLRGDMVGRGIAPDKITVIPNAVDVEEFDPSGVLDRALAADLGLNGCTVLGFIGSFYAYEGLDLLIDALPALLQQHPNARLLLVGGGPQDAALRQRAINMGLADKVMFTGRVPHDQIQRYYDLIDVLVYPRHSMRLTELVTPLKPLEAMAQGRVVVASDVGGHRELIRDGETGRLFRAGSVDDLVKSVMSLLNDSARWPEIRAAGRRFVISDRNWTSSVARYEAPYRKLVPMVTA